MLTQDTNQSVVFLEHAIPAREIAVTPSILGPAPRPVGSGLIGICMGLTARQCDVLAVMMQGKSNKAICRILNLAEPTVKNHVTAILKALKVTNRTEAVIKVAKASASPVSYSYTISGYSTFTRK